jgi:hypothetical protein
MNVAWIGIAVAATPSSNMTPASHCPELAGARTVAHRMSELPAEIRQDLLATSRDEIRDVDIPLLNTDAPTGGAVRTLLAGSGRTGDGRRRSNDFIYSTGPRTTGKRSIRANE